MVVKTKQQNPEWDAWRIASYVSLPEFGDVNVAHKHAKICGVEHKDVQVRVLSQEPDTLFLPSSISVCGTTTIRYIDLIMQ